MLGDFSGIIVRLLRGFWSFKKRINALPAGIKKRILMLIYSLYLRSEGGYVGITANIISPPCLPHGLKGVFISGGATIGKNCVIFQNVTIGANPIPTSKTCGAPTIGDNCYIGAGAAIIGNIKIKNNCRIGANATIFFDISDNCLAINPSPQVLKKENLVNKYYKWSPDGPIYYDKGNWLLEEDVRIRELFKGNL